MIEDLIRREQTHTEERLCKDRQKTAIYNKRREASEESTFDQYFNLRL